MKTEQIEKDFSGITIGGDTLRELLNQSTIDRDAGIMVVMHMLVRPDAIGDFEQILKSILKEVHQASGHISTCVLKPKPGEYCYTTIMKFVNTAALENLNDSVHGNGVLFRKLIAERDSFLQKPTVYKIEESSYATWIDSSGHSTAMKEGIDDSAAESHEACNIDPDSCDNPHGLMIQASFIASRRDTRLFRSRYQRNNKKGGQKNLRCFPGCRNGIHVRSGFCGDAINVHVVMSRNTISGGVKICPFAASDPGIWAFCRFVPVDAAFSEEVFGIDITPGNTISKAEVAKYVRSKGNPIAPLMEGSFKGSASEGAMQSAVFGFNEASKAWHYGWAAPRGQGQYGADIMHVLEILFFKPVGELLYCLESLRSTPFSIYSSRRGHPSDSEQPDETGNKARRTNTESVSNSPPPPSPPGPPFSTHPLLPPADLFDEFNSINFNVANNSLFTTGMRSTPTTIHTTTNATTPVPGANSYVLHKRLSSGSSIISGEDLPWSELYSIFTPNTNSDMYL